MNSLDIPPESAVFRVMGSGKPIELIPHLVQLKAQFPHVEVHLGCDSQNIGTRTIYVTAVVFRFPGNGAHVVYHKEKVNRINDMWTKLWGETERSVKFANYIAEQIGFRVKQIDLDFNTDPAYPSNRILGASEGYIKSLGYETQAKPNLLMAAWAANALCQ